jgi:signal transduction histidine kinase
MDNLTASAIAIVIILIIVVILLTKQRIDTDKKINRMAKQFSLMQYNEKAKAYCKRIHDKYPDLCAGTDYFLKEKGDDVVIEEWNSDQPRPDR